MAVRGIDGFREFFKDYADSFAVIGGCACAEWCGQMDVDFRATQDVDMVLLLESKTSGFFTHFWEYVRLAGYELTWRKGDESTRLFRFVKPRDVFAFPKQIELLTGMENLEIPDDVHVVRLSLDDEVYSLSAILMHPEYYGLVMKHRSVSQRGLPVVDMEVLPLLKMKAHLNLLKDVQEGRFVSEHDRTKHRNDVFQLAMLQPAASRVELSESLKADARAFLDLFSPESDDWESVRQHLSHYVVQVPSAEDLLSRLRSFYQL